MLSWCKRDSVNKNAEMIISRKVENRESNANLWFEQNEAPAAFFGNYFTIKHVVCNNYSGLQRIQSPVSCVSWLPRISTVQDQFLITKYSENFGRYFIHLHNLTKNNTLTTMPVPYWPLSFLSVGTVGSTFRIALWSPFKHKVCLIKVDTATGTLLNEGNIYIREGLYEVMLTENASELWAISNSRPFVDLVSLTKKKNICRFFVQKENGEPIALRRYKSIYLPDRKAGLLLGLNETSLIVINLLSRHRKAVILQNCLISNSINRLSSISLEYQDTNLILLAEGGNLITLFDLQGKREELTVTLRTRIEINSTITRCLGEAQQATLMKKNNWLLLRFKSYVGLVWLDEETAKFPFIVALDLTNKENLNDWKVEEDELWLSTSQRLCCVCKIKSFLPEETKRLAAFEFPMTAILKKTIQPEALEKKLTSEGNVDCAVEGLINEFWLESSKKNY